MRISEYLATEYGRNYEYLKTLFSRFPQEASVSLLRVPAGNAVVWQDDPCNRVYILVEGRARTVIHQQGMSDHAFSDFIAVELFGEYEVLADIKNYLADVRACTDSKFLVISTADYLQWMTNDKEVFFKRVGNVIRTLLQQTARERSSLYMHGTDRMKQFLLDYYKRNARNNQESITVKQTRAAISEETGFSMRTVNRAIQQIHESGLIHIVKGKAVITPEHYLLLLEEMNKPTE